MQTVTSSDATTIAFDTIGSGEPVILVLGAFHERAGGEPLAAWLAEHVTAITYDRRGRGDSSDSQPYEPAREVEDLAALVGAAGGSTTVFGHSSGAVLAMLAAAGGVPIARLALYEPPTPQPGKNPEFWLGLAAEIEADVGAGDRGAAVELFQTLAMGMPEAVVAELRDAPFRPALERIAHTLGYEAQILSADADLPRRVHTPTVVLVGSDSSPTLRAAGDAVAAALPNGQKLMMPGQTHDIVPEAVGPVLVDFCAASPAG